MKDAMPSFSCGRWTSLVLVLQMTACLSEAPQEAPRPLRVALYGAPSSFDPHLQSEAIAQSVLGNVYEALVAFDETMSLVPSLAERWEHLDDGRVVRFYLRRDVAFHDGAALSARDVVFSLERARHHPGSRVASMLVAIEEVRAVDEWTVELVVARPYPILLNKLAFVHVVPDGSPEEITDPVGTGPYRLVSRTPESMTLHAFEKHWNGPPPIAEVELLPMPDAGERLDALLAGEVDVLDNLSPEKAEELEETPGFRVLARDGLAVTYLQVNPTIAPFDDPRVRRAIDLALDRDALVHEILHGYGRPAGQMVSPTVFGYSETLRPTDPDPDEARRLLAAAGLEDVELEIEMRDGRRQVFEPLARQLAAVGFRLRAVVRPWSEMYPRLVSGEVSFYLGGWLCTSGDASDFLDQKVHTRAGAYGTSNANNYSNAEIDRLIEESTRLPMDERRELLNRILDRLADEDVFIPLYSENDIYGVADGIEWTPRLDSRIYAFEMRR